MLKKIIFACSLIIALFVTIAPQIKAETIWVECYGDKRCWVWEEARYYECENSMMCYGNWSMPNATCMRCM